MRSAWDTTFWDYLVGGVFIVYWTAAVARVTYLAMRRRAKQDALGTASASAAPVGRHAPASMRIAPARPAATRPEPLGWLDIVNIVIVGIIGLGFALYLRDAWLASYNVWSESYSFDRFYSRLETGGVGLLLLYTSFVTAFVVFVFGVKIPIDPTHSRTRSDDDEEQRRRFEEWMDEHSRRLEEYWDDARREEDLRRVAEIEYGKDHY